MEYADEFDQLPEELEQLEWAKDVELVKVNMAGKTKVRNREIETAEPR